MNTCPYIALAQNAALPIIENRAVETPPTNVPMCSPTPLSCDAEWYFGIKSMSKQASFYFTMSNLTPTVLPINSDKFSSNTSIFACFEESTPNGVVEPLMLVPDGSPIRPYTV